MISIHDERIQKYLTPYKYTCPVLTGSGIKGAFDEQAVDIPFVFWHGGLYHMLYTGFDGTGYQSALAVSDDLLNWKHKGMVLTRDLDSGRWDRNGGAGIFLNCKRWMGSTGWYIILIREWGMRTALPR